MKFLHTSDLHIGKTVCGFSMLEEQKSVLEQMIAIVKKEKIDVVLLSGDLYDRALPPSQAVTVLDDFLTRLIELGVCVCAIAGNHDSGERIGFANRILEHRGLHLEGVLTEKVRYVDWESGRKNTGETSEKTNDEISEEIGRKMEREKVRIHLIPYAKPIQVQEVYGVPVKSYEEAMQEILRHVDYLEDGKNILVTHQFVVNHGQEPQLSDSESRVSVGGADQVEVANFSKFDYVALGHIHGPQQIGDGPVYYSGSPVKYSFSEVFHEKSVQVGTWDENGELQLKKIALTPIHDMRKIKGSLADLTSPQVVDEADCEDYIMAILTNEEEMIDPIGTLRSVYPNIMQLQIERIHQEREEESHQSAQWKEKTPLELCHSFYSFVMEQDLTQEQEEILSQVIEQAKEESL